MKITEEFNTLRIIDQLIGNLIELETAAESTKKVDLYVKKYVTPMSILPLCVYADTKNISIDHSGCDEEISSYLEFMCFPEGSQGKTKSGKSYLKISKISCDDDSEIISEYQKGIISNAPASVSKANFEQSLDILTGELIDNVKQHANISEYWLCAQYWKASNTCEIAIADAGIGMRKSYEYSAFPASTDQEAIANAIEGCSSKSGETRDRGYGIPTTIKIFCEGYGGEIIMMSGNSLFHLEKKQRAFDIQCEWQGNFIGIKFQLSNLNPYSVISSMPKFLPV